jgi:hypothetical protein
MSLDIFSFELVSMLGIVAEEQKAGAGVEAGRCEDMSLSPVGVGPIRLDRYDVRVKAGGQTCQLRGKHRNCLATIVLFPYV